ncbi:tudor domain-containing 6-like isoform X1 [Cyprinus carpio]|uniref:Tudor domain-containing 6-like isoform X1 n=1 Tax=Cyprinus carpio TaxID=7962 RepID=A0A9Q9Z8E1_CYPCA|nr:tudor domain-containing 6-like isoform X1 [Cyprinus carpio]XP_042633932.1 tudor domain-containing 6-like isoform X1 [Cyprinus carpio]XP_042633933.1 tudor domain-containing 6-like isoform X1 [Cyprinus carpio]
MCSIPGLPSMGSNVPVLITRLNLNPACVLVEFWGNFDQDRKFAYQQLKKEIQYPREGFCESDGNPGDLCLVRVYETWYRARIVSRDTDEYSVFLIDEGRTLRATVNTLAWGKSDFFYLPPEVEFCVLANVLPLSPENKWSAMALEFMKTFCGRRVNATVQDVLVPHRTFLLDIPCLSRQMFEMGFVKKLYSDRFKEFVARSLQANSGSGEPHRISSIRTKPIEIIEQMEKQQAYMYPELQTDTVETVVVTEVTSPFRIFCQLKVFSQELKKLTDQITRYYEGRVGCNFARLENLGSPCASRASDGKWYRSVLQQVMSANNVVEILQVDYGKKQFVQVENVRPLAPEFFRMPVVTYVCSLHGIADRGIGWTASQIDYLKSLLLNRTVIAKFQYQSLSEGVHYVTFYGEENTNINKLFELKQKCSLDSMTLTDFAVQKSPLSQKSKILETTKATHIDETYSDLKGNKPVFFTESLTPNTSHVAVVQHVESPGKFWIQTQQYADEFSQLMNGLGNLYGDPTSTEGLIRKPVVGLLCAAKAQDGVFYRAAIYKVIDKTAEVYFLDYGNTELVDCFNLRQLPLRFQQLPAVAIKCSLYGIKSRLKHWDERATLFFSKLVKDRVLDLHIQDKHQDTHMVQLVDLSLDGENDVSKLLCSADFADSEKSFVDNSITRSCGLKTTHTSSVFLTGAWHQTPSSSSAITDSASAFKEYLFPIGSSLEVTVSYIESPNDFWCQKARNAACLEVLMQDIQRFYAHSKFQPPLEAACVARHPETGIWYRALVIQKHQTPHVDVLFVDYGQTKKVAVEDLRKITPAFLKMKGQAFRCSLYNLIQPLSHSALDWNPEATMQFQEFVDTAASMNVPLKCTIFAVMYDFQKVVFNVVDLETPFQSICNLLVQKHLADRAPSKKAPLPPFRLDTYYYSTHGVKTGCEEEVSITCVKSVTHFFCHLARNSEEIEKLSNKVNFLCRQLEETKCPQTFGTVCFAKYTDGLWYRGQIKSTKPSVVVNFVDYGDTLEVDKSDLLPVPIEAGEIMSIPVQAIECGLSDMPEDVPCEVRNWFQNFADSHCFTALIVAKDPGGKLLVELYEGKTQVNALIRQKFHNEIHRNEPSAFKGYSSKNRSAQSGAIHMKESSSGLKRDFVHQVPQSRDSYAPQEGDVESKQPRSKLGFHTDGRQEPTRDFETLHNSQKQHEPQRKSNDRADVCHPCTSDKTDGVKPKSQALLNESALPVKVIKPGLEAEVFISHCNSPCSFFVQFATDEDGIYSLVEKLNADQSRCANIDPSDIREGDLVCAMFPEDNSWYRAAVRKNIGDTVNVEFVDFGNTATISVSKICRLDQSFAPFPRYSICCSVHKLNVESGDQELAPNFKRVIEQNFEKVMCTFVEMSGTIWEVKLDINGVVLGSTCRGDATPAAELTAPGVKKTSDIKACTHYKNPDISAGQIITGYTSFIKGPQLFWCQYAATDKLQEISDALQNAGNASEKTLSEESLPVGSACIALFTEDNLWYRAKVTSRDHDSLSITFVDYGNEAKVNIGDVKVLPPELSDVPPQAFDCQLEGFDLSKGFWAKEADDVFFELVHDKLLNITVEKMENSEMPHFVKLDCNGAVINKTMRSYWKSQSPETPSVELLSESKLVSTDVSVAAEVNIDSVVIHDSDTDCVDNETCTSVLEMQHSEQEQLDLLTSTKVVNEAQDDLLEMITENVASPDTVSIVPSDAQEDPETICVMEDDPVLAFTSPSDTTHQHAFPKETDPTPLPVILSQHSEGETSIFSENIDSFLMNNNDSQLCIVEGPESPLFEIIKSDLGYLRRATEKPVGSECVIWSHARRNWCGARILKTSDDAALVLLVEHDSEVVVDPLNIFEILPDKPLQTSCIDAAVLSDEVTREEHTTLKNSPLKVEDTEYGTVVTSESEEPNGEETHIAQMDPGDELADQPQATGCVSCSTVLVDNSEVVDVSGEGAQVHDLVEVLTPEQVESKEPQEDLNTIAGEHGEDAAKMSTGVELLMDFLDVAHFHKDVCETALETDDLLEEFNNMPEDLIVLTSDGTESDTASDGTLQGDTITVGIHTDAEESSRVQEKSDASDCASAEVLHVTHLTLKVEDASDDDVIFVGVLQESQAEVFEPESENEKQKLD